MDERAGTLVDKHAKSFLDGKESEGSIEDFRGQLQHYVNESLFFFNKYILGFAELDEKVHGASCGFVQGVLVTPNGLGLFEDPRGYYKSSSSTIGGGLHMVYSDPIALTPYQGCNSRLIIASAKRENAMNFLRLVRYFYETTTLLRFLRPELYPGKGEFVTKGTKQLSVKRTKGFTQPTWDTIGAESGAASRHCNAAFLDDLIHEKNYKSVTEVASAIEFSRYSGQLTSIERGARLFTGNSWDMFDLNNTYLKSAEIRNDIEIFSRSGTACKYCFLGREVKRDKEGAMAEHIHDAKIWPLLPQKAHGGGPETFEGLKKERRLLGSRIYMAQIENETLDPSILDFQMQWLNYYQLEYDDDGKPWVVYWETPAITEGVPEMGRKFLQVKAPVSSMRLFELTDPGLSEKSAEARTANLIVGCSRSSKKIFVLDCWAKAINVEHVPDIIVKKYIEWKPYRIGIESIAAQRLIGPTVRRIAATEYNIRIADGVIIPCYTGRTAKEDRIRGALAPIFEAGHVYIRRDMHDFIDEYRKFPRGRYMDIMDAFSWIAQLWKTPSHFTPEEREKRKRRHALSLMRRRMGRDKVTNY